MIRYVGVILALLYPAFADADLVGVVNGLRAGPCSDFRTEIALLRTAPRLDDAARRMGDGAGLERATSAARYPAKVSASIRLRTLHGDADLVRILRENYCDIVGDDELTEMGAYSFGAETWLVLAAPFTPAETIEPAELDRRVLQLINESRLQPRRCGRNELPAAAPLRENLALKDAAQSHARDMAEHNFLDHKGSSGSRPGERATLAGYRWSSYGENIAAGQTTAEEVVATWLASPGHCETLMNPRYTDTGIAHAVNGDADKGTYWVQIFGRPK